jgi:transcriptional regulator NrdR family protein
MKCPLCYSEEFDTIDSRPSLGTIKRRRRCKNCQHRWTTYEVSAETYNRSMPVVANRETVNKIIKIILDHIKADIPLIVDQYLSGRHPR